MDVELLTLTWEVEHPLEWNGSHTTINIHIFINCCL